LEIAKHREWSESNEWNFTAYKYEVFSWSNPTGSSYSTLKMTLKLIRYQRYYELTLFIPVLTMAFLSTIGMLLPGTKYFSQI
jgi:hypothetical protein